jgi:hypothetical protein
MFDAFWDYYRTKRAIPTLAGKGNATIEACTTDNKFIAQPRKGKLADRLKDSCRNDFVSIQTEADQDIKGHRRYLKAAIRAWVATLATPSTTATGARTIANITTSPSGGTVAAGEESAPTLSTAHMPKLKASSGRADIIKALVQWIQDQPYNLFKIRKGILKTYSPCVTGWDERLKQYSYANSNTKSHYRADFIITQGLLRRAATLATVLKTAGTWSSSNRKDASDLAVDIIEKWGGIRARQNKSPGLVESVFRFAAGLPCRGTQLPAAMNSSWTKVAAFASGRNGHVIWDSRASASITWRLDQLQTDGGKKTAVKNIFPELTLVSAKGRGTRDRMVYLSWQTPAGNWTEQSAATAVVKEIVKVLNDPANGYPRMLVPNGTGGYCIQEWDVWGVGQVLFMDGY